MSSLTELYGTTVINNELPINSRTDIVNVPDLYYAPNKTVWLKTGTTISAENAFAFPAAGSATAVLGMDYYNATIGNSFAITGYTPAAIRVHPALTQMFVLGEDALLRDYQMSDGSVASLTASPKTFSFATQSATASSFCFSYYGTKLYYMDATGIIYQYSLGVAWDITTAVYDAVNVDTGSFGPSYQVELNFDPTGLILGTGGVYSDSISFSLSTAWDLSTIAFIRSGSGNQGTGYSSFTFLSTGGGALSTSSTTASGGLFMVLSYPSIGFRVDLMGSGTNRINDPVSNNKSLSLSPDDRILYVLASDNSIYQVPVGFGTIGDPTPAGNTYIRIA